MKKHTKKSNLDNAYILTLLKRNSIEDKALDYICIAGIFSCLVWMVSLYMQLWLGIESVT